VTTRRRLLSLAAAAGAASAAGCSLSGDDEGPEYDEAAIADVTTGDVPTVDPTLPVGPADEHVEASLTRARELLDRVPESVPSSEVPNGVIRTRIERRRSETAEYLKSVAEPEATLEGLHRSRRARENAAGVETMYAVSVRERTLEDVLGRVESVGEDLGDVEADFGYRGEGLVETLVTAGTAERYLATVRRILSSPEGRHNDSEVMAAAEAGERIETAAAHVEDARHVRERFAASQDDPDELEATFEAALESLRADLLERCSEYDDADRATPSSLVDASIEDTPAEGVLDAQLFRVRANCDRPEEDDDLLARRLLRVHGAYHNVLALSEALERIEDGQFRMPADAAALDDRRTRATNAIESAESATTHPRLTSRRLENATSHVKRGDETGTRGASSNDVEKTAREYDVAFVMAATATDATEWLVGGLRSAAAER
jgi:hypothetical protein